jgi:hypothetical protein
VFSLGSVPKTTIEVFSLGSDPKENTVFNNSPIVALWGIPHITLAYLFFFLAYFPYFEKRVGL